MKKELSSCEAAAILVEYARGGKTPSIWWNGIEYKWDKKHGKYLHWTTLPSGERKADEPPYEATNPLFAASDVSETDDKNKTPKDEEKPLPPMTANHPIGREKEPKQQTDPPQHKKEEPSSAAPDEKPLAPMTATGPASHEAKKDQPIQRAEDFESIADEVRSKIMSPEEAKSDKENTRKYVDDVNNYVALQVEVWDLDAAHSKSLNEYDPNQTYEDFRKSEAEYEQKRSAIWDKIQPVGEDLKAKYMQMSDRESDRNLEFLKAAFPDSGGETFYYDSDKEYFLSEFKKRGLEKEARRALDVLDVIGRCFNTNNIKRMLPEVVFDKNASNAGYKAGANQIVFPENEKFFKNAQLSALHELGHWFDFQVLGPDEMNETYDWLKSETGIKREQELTANDNFSYQIPVGQSRGLGVHYSGYSETVYPPRRFMDVHGNIRQIRGGTEMVSTAFEYLGYNPEAFAKKNKKHFDRTLRWFQKVSETKR